jgi:hypothetical protein
MLVEWRVVRQSTNLLYASFTEDQMKSLGIPASVRRIERYDEDKKIGLIDAFDSLKAIIKYNFFDRKYIHIFNKRTQIR